MTELATGRLLLRQWREVDLEPFAALNRDAEVMRYFPAVLTKAQSDALAQTASGFIAQRGWDYGRSSTFQAAHSSGSSALPNRGLMRSHSGGRGGMRLGRGYWGHGYATEAAGAALSFGFGQPGLQEIVSFTAAGNTRSQRVMNRLGMSHDPAEDFDHPAVDGTLRRHVLFRISDEHWQRDSGRTLAGSST